jgi:hypothetical protein
MKMTNKLIASLMFCGFAAVLSCDNGASQTSGHLSDDDCPIGTFKPIGHTTCEIPADDQFGGPLAVSDNRCQTGQPAFPPTCVSDGGGRPFFTTSMDCGPGYQYVPGACQRGGGPVGAAGVTGAPTGFAGAGFDPTGGAMTGAAGSTAPTGIATGAGAAEGTGSGTGAAGMMPAPAGS